MKRKKNGFSVRYYTKGDIVDYTVYFEQKGKVTFCTIEDYTFEKAFKGKSVCHADDTFSEPYGRKIAFIKAWVNYIEFVEGFNRKVLNELNSRFEVMDKLKEKSMNFITKN